jgi:uncharacterized alkaline shock family protein YloU
VTAVPQLLAAARAAVDAARAVPGVVDLSDGAVGEFATYSGGERVPGVRIRTGERPAVRLRLVVAFGQVLPELSDEVGARVRKAAGPLLGDDDITVDLDIVDVRLDTGAGLTQGELEWRS